MTILTIPKKITKGEDLIIVPRKQYEEALKWQSLIRSFRIFTPTVEQKRDLKQARGDYKKGKHISINEFKRKLGIRSAR